MAELEEAARALYLAGRWTAANVSDADAAKMWERLRDAIGLPAGTATAHGVAADSPTSCPKHPAYDAAKPPIYGCGWCWRYWNFTQKAKRHVR